MNSLMILASTNAADAESSNVLDVNWAEVLVVAVGFAILMFITVKFIVPMFEKTYAARTEAIEGGIAKAEKAQAEASAALDAYKQQLVDARTEANRIREEARSEGAQILADLKERAAAESARILDQAQATIAAERQAAVISLRDEVGSLATTLAGRIVGESLDDDARANRVVDRFLADLEQQTEGAVR